MAKKSNLKRERHEIPEFVGPADNLHWRRGRTLPVTLPIRHAVPPHSHLGGRRQEVGYRGADPKPALIYWLGLSKIASDDARTREAGVLQLCYLPAIYGKDYEELAGAGLYESMVALDKLNDTKGSIAVRKELLVRYAHTVHGSKVKSESGLRKAP